MTPDERTARARVAAFHRRHPQDPKTAQLAADFRADRLALHIARVVDAAPPLSPSSVTAFLTHHRKLLEASGIPVQFALDLGIHSVTDAELLPEGLRWTSRRGGLPGLLFPWKAPGCGVQYQLRPDNAVVLDGQARKYIQPAAVHLLNVLVSRV